MEFADIVLKRIEGEENPKRSFNALVCFSNRDSGRALGKIIDIIVHNRAGKSNITMLNLIDSNKALEIEDDNVYKSNLLADIISQIESDKFTVRTFVKEYDNFVNEVLKTAEEYDSELILIGTDKDIFNSHIWSKYLKLRGENIIDEDSYHNELGEELTRTIRDISTMMNRNDQITGLLIGNKIKKIERVFIPILKDEDILTLSYVCQFAKNQNITATIWDAIGILSNSHKMQKLFTTVSKKTDGRVKIWNNNKKISVDFINTQDLMIIGKTGWDKLIFTPLSWINDLPSTLIIKDKKIEA